MGALVYLGAFTLGALVALAELMARYRDEPFRAVRSWASAAYLLTNGGASCVALYIVKAVDLKFGIAPEASEALLPLWQVLVAGASAVAFFRSALFNVRVGEKDIQIGPGAMLQILTGVLDRAVDRNRARQRTRAVALIMREIDFAAAWEALPVHCVALMQNLSPEESERIGQSVKDLKGRAIPDDVKALNLGLILMNAIGEDVLKSAIESLGENIRKKS